MGYTFNEHYKITGDVSLAKSKFQNPGKTSAPVLDNKMDEEIKKFGVAKTQNDPYSEIDVGKVRITAKSHY